MTGTDGQRKVEVGLFERGGEGGMRGRWMRVMSGTVKCCPFGMFLYDGDDSGREGWCMVRKQR